MHTHCLINAARHEHLQIFLSSGVKLIFYMQLATKGESDLAGFEINAAIALDAASWSVFQNLTMHIYSNIILQPGSCINKTLSLVDIQDICILPTL